METILKLNSYINSAIPYAWDDSESWFEFLAKLLQKVNELVEASNDYFAVDLVTYTENLLASWVANGTMTTLLNTLIANKADQTAMLAGDAAGIAYTDSKNTLIQEMLVQYNISLTSLINGVDSSLTTLINNVASGSPAGTYPSLTALNTANPDHSKIYVTLNDGKWCYYDTGTSAFVAGEVYTAPINSASDIPTSASGVNVQEVLSKNTYLNGLKVEWESKNLINPESSQRIDNFYVDYPTGKKEVNSGWTTFLIPVGNATHVSMRGVGSHYSFTDRFVDLLNLASFTVVPGWISESGGNLATATLGNVAIPDGAEYLIFSCVTGKVGSEAQVEYGGIVTAWEAYAPDVPESAAVKNKLDADYSKNLFNPAAENKVTGKYVAYNNGHVEILSTFDAVVVEVSGGSVVSFNRGNIHVCALSAVPNLPYYQTNTGTITGRIDGFADVTAKQGYVIPSNAICLVVSYPRGYAGSLQVEYAEASTDYVPYIKGIDASNIIGLIGLKGVNITVGSGGDYETIADAVAAASDGDTILVMPGIYEEAIDIRSTGKYLKIKGFSRDSCILTYDSGNYDLPPLEMAKGVVEDMTILATGTTLASGATHRAYCVHIDDNESINSSLQFKNVRFKNQLRQCVGIGLRENFRLSFVNCEFETDDMDCVYAHEQQDSNKTGQYMEFIDCSFKRNSSGRMILLQETPALTGNEAIIRMQRCITVNEGGTVIIADQFDTQPGLNGSGYLGTYLWTLDTASKLNSDALLNA